MSAIRHLVRYFSAAWVLLGLCISVKVWLGARSNPGLLRSDTIRLIERRTYWGWRIDRPDPVFRLLASVVSGRLHLSIATQIQLTEFCARHPEVRCD